MIGYTVYIMMRREVLSGKDTLLSLHATFDGAFYAMKAERDYAIEKGYTVEDECTAFLWYNHEALMYGDDYDYAHGLIVLNSDKESMDYARKEYNERATSL